MCHTAQSLAVKSLTDLSTLSRYFSYSSDSRSYRSDNSLKTLASDELKPRPTADVACDGAAPPPPPAAACMDDCCDCLVGVCAGESVLSRLLFDASFEVAAAAEAADAAVSDSLRRLWLAEPPSLPVPCG